MKPPSLTSCVNDSLSVKLYSRPSSSPGRGARVVCETEKPKWPGYASNSRLRSVDLPAPEGPETTMGRAASPARRTLWSTSHADAKAERDVRPTDWGHAGGKAAPSDSASVREVRRGCSRQAVKPTARDVHLLHHLRTRGGGGRRGEGVTVWTLRNTTQWGLAGTRVSDFSSSSDDDVTHVYSRFVHAKIWWRMG